MIVYSTSTLLKSKSHKTPSSSSCNSVKTGFSAISSSMKNCAADNSAPIISLIFPLAYSSSNLIPINRPENGRYPSSSGISSNPISDSS